MTRTTFGLFASVIALSGFAYACSSLGAADAESAGASPSNGGKEFSDSGSPGASAAPSDLAPVDNAVILVHASKVQAFRLCFENELELRPQPDSQVMPEANVVGVQVGTAVRLGPLKGAPGKIFLFEEALIRSSYAAFGGAEEGPSCNTLLTSSEADKAITLPEVTTDLSRGVHLLVVRGCPKNSPVKSYSVAECGDTWTALAGNLGVTEITLTGAPKQGSNLPAQVVNLSQTLESARNGQDVVVTFGEVANEVAKRADVATNPGLFAGPSPTEPAQLAYDSTNLAVYDSVGFRVQLGTTTVLDQSLAQIQKLSSPRDLPRLYYGAASNYALLLLGDPAVGDASAPDLRKQLHFLAVPVIEPREAGAPDPGDGGAATPTP